MATPTTSNPTQTLKLLATKCAKQLDDSYACETEHGYNNPKCYDSFISLKTCVDEFLCPKEYAAMRKCSDESKEIGSCGAQQSSLDKCVSEHLKQGWKDIQ